MTLSYEDCEQLRDAGFPGLEQITANNVPDLSALIKACGRIDFTLRQRYSAYENKTFYVIERPGADDMERQDTPELAVKNLWLALNKK